MWVFKVLSQTLKTRFLEWQRLFSYFYTLLVLMKTDKLLVPNMFSVLIFKHIFSNLPLDYNCICPKMELRTYSAVIMCPNDADRMANSADPDQTAPKGAV